MIPAALRVCEAAVGEKRRRSRITETLARWEEGGTRPGRWEEGDERTAGFAEALSVFGNGKVSVLLVLTRYSSAESGAEGGIAELRRKGSQLLRTREPRGVVERRTWQAHLASTVQLL